MGKRLLIAVLGVILFGAALAFLTAGKPATTETNDVQKQLDDMKAAFDKLADDNKKLADQVSHLAKTSPPIGSVQAFAGDWPPRKADGTPWTELEIGWVLCDGRKLADVQAELHKQLEKQDKKVPEDGILADLRAVLPQLPGGKPAEGLPDYRGYFLRGADNGANRDAGRILGSAQTDSTRRPNSAFVTDEKGEHGHDAAGTVGLVLDDGKIARFPAALRKSAGTPSCLDFKQIKADGKHKHTITDGGDPETRPINVAVHFIIKFK